MLQAVIDDYVATAEPVGSATVARKYALGVSPATIRNEMANLEEEGYLEQPHASAGRIPSDKGYRYYVDALVERKPVSESDRHHMFETLAAHRREMADLAHAAVRLLSGTTNCLVLLTGPGLSGARCHGMQFVPLQPGRVLLVLVTEDGFLHGVPVELDPQVAPEEMARASRMMSDRFRGWPLEAIEETATGWLCREPGLSSLFAAAWEGVNGRAGTWNRREVYLGGATNLLRQPEFRDAEKVFGLLSALEEEAMASRLLAGFAEEGVSVAIGDEIPVPPMDNCSLVAAGYCTGWRSGGRIGVLGPRRMDYGAVMSMVDEISQCITQILTYRTG